MTIQDLLRIAAQAVAERQDYAAFFELREMWGDKGVAAWKLWRSFTNDEQASIPVTVLGLLLLAEVLETAE